MHTRLGPVRVGGGVRGGQASAKTGTGSGERERAYDPFMVPPKTRPTDASVDEFLAAVPGIQRRADAVVVEAMMREVTGESPVIWGTSIVGYGAIEYPGSRGKQASWPIIAFASRKTELVI